MRPLAIVPKGGEHRSAHKHPRLKRTLASDVFQRLRADILHCTLRPNSRLLFRDLRVTYASGMSPLREALMRLVSDGLVILEDHKGFRVAPVSRDELVDIARTRCELEGLALRMSIEQGDDRWESNILARFHELSKRPTYVAGTLDYEWERRHDAFHRALYAASGLQWLTSFCETLSDRAFRYRHLLLEVVDRTRDHRSEHDAIQRAAIDRQPDIAVARLKDHYMRTVQTLIDNWTELS